MTNNPTIVPNVENWFIPIDVIMILSTSFVVILSLIFCIVIIFDRTRYNVSTLLIFNSFTSEFIFGAVMCTMAIYTLLNDIKQIAHQDSFCVFRGYLSYALSAVRSHSYLLQSFYRYMLVVHPLRVGWRSVRFQLVLISISWIISMVHPFPFLFTNQIQYNLDNQVCHMPLQNYPYIFYTCSFAYLYPVTIIIIIYVKLVRYTKAMSRLVTPVNQLARAQREVKMVRRIVMLVIFLIALGLPYTGFFITSFFTTPYAYYFRIAFLFVDVSLVFVIIALVQFHDPVNNFVTKKIHDIFTITTV